VDFGNAHVVRDPNGEPIRNAIIASIMPTTSTNTTSSTQLTIYVVEGKRIEFVQGDYVAFREVSGYTWLNDGKPRCITNVDIKARSFTIELLAEDAAHLAAATVAGISHNGGGLVEQVKVPKEIPFASLANRIINPIVPGEGMLITPDLGKFGRPEQIHIAFQALHAWSAKNTPLFVPGGSISPTLPPIRSSTAVEEIVAEARAWILENSSKGEEALRVETLDETFIREFAMVAGSELQPLCAFFGGVAAQEVVKFTGKYTPIRQYLYLDAVEILPKDHTTLPASEFTPTNSRYDNAVAMLGRTVQSKLMDYKVFVVGAGALGCEFLKNYALMGVGCGANGRLTVTDMDRIEISNLSRQFLFRQRNVGAPKSVTAAAAAQAMNGDLKVVALEIAVGEDTENTFDDAFWENTTLVTNALDNLKARTYVDNRCIFFAKPLLESGTLGTKANTQVILPRLTECYSDSVDPPEESIPMCTLRNFPHAIEHCIEWARDLFAGNFSGSVQEAAAFAADPNAWIEKLGEEANLSARRAKAAGVVAALDAARSVNWAWCVASARRLAHEQFHVSIRQLLHNFPADYTDPKTGVKFWSPPKRTPDAMIWDPVNNPEHFNFIAHAAALFASNYGVPEPEGGLNLVTHASELAAAEAAIIPFTPKQVRIKADENDATVEGGDDDGEAVANLTATLRAAAADPVSLKALHLIPAEFEKDDDTNHHIAFITSASNLRAANYRISPATFFQVKIIAGM
jgi:ubiquitin-activating enzyme E1